MADLIQLRNDTEAHWTSVNPILAKGEVAISSDFTPPKIKIGDGIAHWVSLTYFSSSGSVAWGSVSGKPNFADPSWKGVVANQAAVPLTLNAIGDTYVVIDDGDGKGALYVCKATSGLFAVQWGKEGDVDFGTSTGTPSNTYAIGDGLASNKSIIANTAATNKPALRFNNASSKWEYCNDGTTYSEMGSGSGGSVNIDGGVPNSTYLS